MDIEMKVQILRACSSKKGNRCSSCPAFGHGDRNCIRNAMKDAATALSTLQAENERLRVEVENYRKGHCAEDGCATEKDRDAVLAELEQVKRALAMMWFAYVNKDEEYPHSFELEALEKAESILGPWAECMPKYLRRGQKED